MEQDAWVPGLGCSEPWNSWLGPSAQLSTAILKSPEPGAFPHKRLKFLGKTEGEEVGGGHDSDQSKPVMAGDQDSGNGQSQ